MINRKSQTALAGRTRSLARSAAVAAWLTAAGFCLGTVFCDRAGADAPGSALPLSGMSPRPHQVGDIFTYSLHGTLSQAIVGKDAFGRAIHQAASPTDLQGRERVAVKSVSSRGISLHRSGSILATFKGRSSPAQSGNAWTLVTPKGDVQDRKGSTLGGLFLLPLGFLGERAVNDGSAVAVGSRWSEKLGMALFGMIAQPMMRYQVVGSRKVFGVSVVTIAGTGSVGVKEPIVTNEGVALGNALGTAHVTLRCDYDPASLRAIAMDIDVHTDLHVRGSRDSGSGTVTDRQHYLVALDAGSIESVAPVVDPPAPQAAASAAPPR